MENENKLTMRLTLHIDCSISGMDEKEINKKRQEVILILKSKGFDVCGMDINAELENW